MITDVTSSSDWYELPKLERDMLICAREASGILPYAVQHDTEIDPSDRDVAAARTVLTLVDRGWVTVHRLIPDPDGYYGFVYGPAIARVDLDGLLADPDTWDDPSDHEHWYGELALDMTQAGLTVTRS